jgi:hypothetical protein
MFQREKEDDRENIHLLRQSKYRMSRNGKLVQAFLMLQYVAGKDSIFQVIRIGAQRDPVSIGIEPGIESIR